MSDLSWLNPTPHAIAVYASQPLSPVATPNTRYQADATPYLGRTSTGWIAPALPGALIRSSLCAASKTWRRLKGTNQLPKVIAGVRFENGIEVIQVPANHAA